ncbi:hypothetical protein [Halanaerobium congolense]|jgi:hypothetical protein|uniref:Uncharacterized protein n=1 Tax=Halanaerobium congolense TaxID=54121 RepID=A0A1G6I1K5_9FIRM|nr:hypothetical protein [Halanaerobium congolense]KXS50485.1 MAG: hypothetical protein AWL62_101 [Halanaerobium sp. T82-1]OEG62029.1 MAG: hypothetical protein BHK79_04555 [Halanaerobium sp. MDAL1]PUU91294.1 MAG: hypothetical protein CI948_1208 [Halanaerobium sp.]PTX17024.1 hypothetical protein C7953_1777 [Halanaerobium congolense]PXV65971.1 hypothetical protein C8C78_11221 [Halanaerobium congolense]
MKLKNQAGYVLFLNLILITLIALFIPLVIQEQKINYRILSSRIKAAQNKEAVESGLQYQLYFLKNKSQLCNQKIYLDNEIELRLRGEEDSNYIYFYTYLDDVIPYNAEMKLSKEDFKIIDKKIYRSE